MTDDQAEEDGEPPHRAGADPRATPQAEPHAEAPHDRPDPEPIRPAYIGFEAVTPPRGAEKAYLVRVAGDVLGTVVLTMTTGRYGAAVREWSCYAPGSPTPDNRRPCSTRGHAVSRLRIMARERSGLTERRRPAPDPTRERIDAAVQQLGPGPALWLAASLTIARIEHLQAERAKTNPAATWQELEAIRTWMLAAIDTNGHNGASIYYRRTEADFEAPPECRLRSVTAGLG